MKPNQKAMFYNENDLNLKVKSTESIFTNATKTIFYNRKTGREIKVVRNCRSFGIWNKKKFIPLSKMQIVNNNNYSDELNRLLNQF